MEFAWSFCETQKNKDVPPEEAAEAFRKVVHAFEVLSDSNSRRNYDRTGRDSTQQQRSSGCGGGFQLSWSWSSSSSRSSSGGRTYRTHYNRPKPKLKDKFEVKEAQSRVLHIVSLEQLEAVIVDDDDTLERNLLICFYTPPMEQHLNDEMVYPWPFAAMSSQGIWWEDLLQTTTVRFHRANDLTEFFGIPNGETMKNPIFVFGKRGANINDAKSWPRLETRDRKQFDDWVWKRMEVQIQFVNQHDHPVEIYWIHGTNAKNSLKLEPGASETHTTMLSHEWWVRDARTDTRSDSPGRHRLSSNNCLITWKILNDQHLQQLVIPLRTCYDLSGHCGYWKNQNQCNENPKFMGEDCRLSCGLCTRDEDKEDAEGEEPKKNDGHDEL